MIKKIGISAYLAMVTTVAAFSQSADEKGGMMLNGVQRFELREFYETDTDSGRNQRKPFAIGRLLV